MPRRIPTQTRPPRRRPPFIFCGLVVAAMLLGLALTSRAQPNDAAAADDRLYRAWGGEAGIRAVVQDLVPRLFAHPRIGPFFKDSNRQHLTKQLTAQLCQLAGGPCAYDGADMKAAHRDMGVGRGDFNALVEALQQSMDAQGLPFDAQMAMLARLAPMHRDIVER